MRLELKSIMTCPGCGFAKCETMPTNACQVVYECERCARVLRPRTGDCCVFCSYGSMPCPPIQIRQSGGDEASCCGG